MELSVSSRKPAEDLLEIIRERIKEKVMAAQLELSPFPHMIMENFFPEEVFGDILRFNPFKVNAGSEWFKRSVSSNVSSRTPYFARKQINFHQNDSFDAEPEEKAFWDVIKDCFLGDHWFEQLVHQKFSEYFAIRFGDIVNDAGFYDEFRRELFLQRHEPGYYIGPHTDVPTRVFTCIFSFAETTGFEEFGTEMLVHKNRLNRCWGTDHYPPDDFIVNKVAPYSPNNCLIFFKTRHSFHSVRAIDATVPNQRYGMQFQFLEPPHGLFTDLSRPDLMETSMAGNRGIRQQAKTLAKAVLKSVRKK